MALEVLIEIKPYKMKGGGRGGSIEAIFHLKVTNSFFSLVNADFGKLSASLLRV